MVDCSETFGYHYMVSKDASGIDYALAEDVFGFRRGMPVAIVGEPFMS